jgi:hypothetical protein
MTVKMYVLRILLEFIRSDHRRNFDITEKSHSTNTTEGRHGLSRNCKNYLVATKGTKILVPTKGM